MKWNYSKIYMNTELQECTRLLEYMGLCGRVLLKNEIMKQFQLLHWSSRVFWVIVS
jgi:hypothetical protein